MSYFSEFRINWLSLLATFIGISTGSAIEHYTMSLFGPELIKEFGWSKSEFALLGSLPLFTLFMVPLVGRFTDRFGPRIAGAIGFGAMSLGFFGFSVMTGSIVQFFMIWVVQHILGLFSTSLVFSRLLVAQFDKARGTALSVLMMGPPLAGAIVAPLLAALIAAEGWRAGFLALAIVSAVGGVICVFLMGKGARHAAASEEAHVRLTGAEFVALMRNRAFPLLVGGMALINLPQVFSSSQLKLIIMSGGITDQVATWMVSLYAIGVIIGRAVCGLALDRVPAHLVALFALSLPGIGYFILATPGATAWLLAIGVLIIGLAQGAEGDIGGYLVSRHFDLKNFSLVFGCVKAGLDGGGAIGALILSYTLHVTDSYVPFLVLVSVTTLLGAFCFFLTGKGQVPGASAAEAVA